MKEKRLHGLKFMLWGTSEVGIDVRRSSVLCIQQAENHLTIRYTMLWR